MKRLIAVSIDGESVAVPQGMSVAAAILSTPRSVFRRSVNGERRGAICGMGICFECRVTIDGRPHQRACLSECREGMEIATGA
jgi:D-hydroxyproline dehydrogenase subunit gamma